jgi:glycolate oxidase FAD binding subunit
MKSEVDCAQSELAAIVGPSRVVTEETACQSVAIDGLQPKSVVYPESSEQVAGVLKCAAEHELAVIPFRNATKLAVGNRPRRYDVALCLKDLNNVWHYEPADLTVSVEPGVKLGDLQRLLARDKLWLPLDPPGGARASLGGIIATNATGPLRLFYGAPRDMVLGMKIATAQGKVIKTGGRVVKNVAGYDLSKLLIGSYGTLGVIVEANLKLFPLPAERATFVFRVPTPDAARELRRQILHSPLTPIRMVFMDAEFARPVLEPPVDAAAGGESAMWVEAAGSKRVIERYARTLEELGRAAGAPAASLEPAVAERGWERITDFRAHVASGFPDAVILRAAFLISSIDDYVNRARQECERAKARLAVFGQPGSGVVHLVLAEVGGGADQVALVESLRTAANGLGGALVVERCSPEMKTRIDVWGRPGSDFEIMRKLKQAWDPKGILSPGRFVGAL